MTISAPFDLRLTHLRFDCRATSPIQLGGHTAGNALRNALANVMLRATCPEAPRRGEPSPEHAAVCPAWMKKTPARFWAFAGVFWIR
jgi:hypothetical protein